MRMTAFVFTRLYVLAAKLAFVVLVMGLVGCATGASNLEQGNAITTGKEPYDTFFSAVREAREEAQKAEVEVTDARAKLTRSLGLAEGTSADEAIRAVQTKATKLREGGVLLHLDITPETKLVHAAGRSGLDGEEKSTLDAIEESAKSALSLSDRLAQLAVRIGDLKKQRVTLEEQAKTAFEKEPSGRQKEVENELAAAERVLAEALNLGEKHAGLAAKFVVDLARAVETGAGDSPKRPTARPGRRSPGRSPAKGATPPNAATAKPTPGGDDFDP